VPEGIGWQVLKPVLPKFLSYVISFLFVGIYWVNHHHLLHTLPRVNGATMWANLNLLFWLSLIPVLTAWMGQNNFDRLPVAIYAVLALLCGVSFDVLRRTIAKQYPPQSALKHIDSITDRKTLLSIALYTAAVPVAWFVNPAISGVLFVLVSIMWLIPDKRIEQALKP
jgi:uncharacterized membrane protein